MKKILFLLTILFSSGTFAQKLINIKGSIAVKPETAYTYQLNFDQDLTETTTVEIEISHGHFSDNQSKSTLTLYRGAKTYPFTVYWSKVKFTNAYITAYITTDPSNKVKLEKIQYDLTEGIPSEYKITMEGPKIIYMGDNASIKANLDPELNSKHKYKWDYSNGYLGLNKLDQLSTSVTAFVTATLPIKRLNIPISIVDRTTEAVIQTVDFPIEIRPNFYIVPGNGAVFCNNENITMKIKNIEYTPGAIIAWDAVDKLTLLPGQGTGPSATFNTTSSSNGYARIKAIVKYDGIDYNLENSNVWVGKPGIGSLDVGNGSTVVAKNSYTFHANMEGTNVYTTYKWVKDSGMGKFMVIGDEDGDSDFVSIFPTGAQGSFFEFHVDATNYCGTTTKYFWVIVNSGFDTRSASLEEINSPEIKSVKIYNLSGVLVYSDNAVNSSFDIKSTVLTDGIYIIEKSDGQNRTSEKVMLKR